MKKLKVLVGDDEIGIEGSIYQKSFLRNYREIEAEYHFESTPEKFIQEAKKRIYDAFLIDLNWEEADLSKKYKTGFRVLESVKDYAIVRLLHTSDDDLRKEGIRHGATRCIEKHRGASYLEKALRGSKEEN